MSSDHPLHIVFIIRDGGGTGSAELTVAAKLADRGHQVRLFGPPEVADRASSRGFQLHPLSWPPGTEVRDLMAQMVAAGPAWSEQIRPALANADLLIADCAWFGPLIAARAAGIPTIGLMSTIYVADAPQFAHHRPAVDAANKVRVSFGLPEVASLTDQVLDADRLFLLTSRAFELPSVRPPSSVRYVGPQLPHSETGASVVLPDGDAPLILVSLSTTEQDQFQLLRRIITALGSMPVRALVTTGPIDTDLLPAPDNVVLESFVAHDRVLPAASLVITHAGHGTVLAAVSSGVPLVCIPMGRDQPAVAARVIHHGVGVTIDPATDADSVAEAAQTVLNDPTYRAAAQQTAAMMEPPDLVFREVESVLQSTEVADTTDRSDADPIE